LDVTAERTESEQSSPDEAERLVAAAWGVLARTGFEGFKVASVIRAAGSSTKAFYRHFDGKEAMLLALLLDESTRASARLARRVSATTTPTDAVLVWIATILGSAASGEYAARARLFSSLGQINAHFPRAIMESRQRMMAPLLEALTDGSRSGEFPHADPASDAALVMALCGAVLRDLVDHISQVAVEHAINDTQSFVLRSLGVTRRPSQQAD